MIQGLRGHGRYLTCMEWAAKFILLLPFYNDRQVAQIGLARVNTHGYTSCTGFCTTYTRSIKATKIIKLTESRCIHRYRRSQANSAGLSASTKPFQPSFYLIFYL